MSAMWHNGNLYYNLPINFYPHSHYVKKTIELEEQCVLRVKYTQSHHPHHKRATEVI